MYKIKTCFDAIEDHTQNKLQEKTNEEIFFVVVVVALFIMSNSNVWAGTKSCPQCWAELKAKGIKSVKVTPIATRNIVKVHMGSIKQALERAGINEPVSIFLSFGDKNPGYLGSFAPTVRDDGEHGDGAAHRSLFKSIPMTKNVKVAPSLFNANLSKTSSAVARSSTYARPSRPSHPDGMIRPSRPSNPETLIRPSRPSNPETAIRPSRPSNPETMIRPSRPSRPSGPASQIRTQTRQGLLTFKNSKGQTMVYLPVEINGM